MKCRHCGVANDADSKFCKECGQGLGAHAPAASAGSGGHVRIGELIYAAYRYKEDGNIEEAMLACQGALALNPASAPAHALLGSLYELKGDIPSAVHEYERVIALSPDSVAEQRKLEELRTRLVEPAHSPPAMTDWMEKFRPYIPHAAALVSLVFILLVGLALVNHGSGETGGSEAAVQQPPMALQPEHPQVAPPVQPYTQPQYPQEHMVQPQPEEEDRPEQRARTAQATQPGGVPPVPVPGALPVREQRPVGNSEQNIHAVPQLPAPRSGSPPAIVPIESDDRSVQMSPYAGAFTQKDPPAVTPAQQGEGVIVTRAVGTSESPEERAVKLQREGRYQEAVNSYREALSRTEDGGRIYQQMGLCYQRLGQKEQAADSYKKAIRSYNDQLAAGRDASTIERNIKACEAGIKINQ